MSARKVALDRRKSFLYQYRPLLRIFFTFTLSLVILLTSPGALHAFKLLAQEAEASIDTVVSALLVPLLEVFINFFVLVYYLRPQWLPVHRCFQAPSRAHRTHISHLRLDRVAKFYARYGYEFPREEAAVNSPHPGLFKGLLDLFKGNHSDVHLQPGNDIPGVTGTSGTSSEVSEDVNEVSEDEAEDAWSSTESDDDHDDDDDVPDHHHLSPPNTLPHIHSPCQHNNFFAIRGGGSDQPQQPSPPPPPPVEISDDDDLSSDADGGPVSMSDWMGTGKTWSEQVPSIIKYALKQDRVVPLDARQSVIPDEKVSVSDVLFEALPPPESDSVPASFSMEPENMEGTSTYWYHSLTSAVPFLPALRAGFNNAWLAGAKSISFPHLPDKRYPLWTENFLSDIQSFIQKRSRWQRAREWLMLAGVGYLPWDGIVAGLSPAVHLTSQDLASFLGTDWLNDDMINAGVDYILRRLEPWSRIRILNCLFSQSLANAHAAGGSYRPRRFSPIDKAIQAGKVDTIYFPLHVTNNHWTLLKIDLVSNTIAFADSLGGSVPSDKLALVRWWLKSLLPDSPHFSLVPPDFPCPRQRDGHSCGIIVLSMLATILLGYDPWTPEHADCYRLQWFLNLSEPFAIPHDYGVDSESEFDIIDGPFTTPEPSDFEDNVLSELSAPSDFEGAESSESEPNPTADISFPSSPMICDREAPSGLQLEEVDFFLDLQPTAEPVIEMPDFEMPDAPAPAPATDDWVPLPPPAAGYYQSDGEQDSDSDSGSGSDSQPRVYRRSGPKAGSSWARQKKLKSLAKDPEFKASTTRLGTFREKVLQDDPLAEFDDDDVRRVRCSRCATWITMRVLYDLVRWRTHRETAKCTKNSSTGLSTRSLFSLGFKKLPPGHSTSTDNLPLPPPRRSIPLPCPGLTRESDEEIATYMARTSVTGGGAPSRSRIAMDLFSMKYSELDSPEQRMVLRRESTLQKWKMGRAVGAVYSAACLRDVLTLDGDAPSPCDECQNLYKLHTFRVAIHRPMPEEGAMKFVPVAYRDKELGTLYLRYHGVRDLIELDDGRSPWLKFAVGCVDGTYNSDTLTGMVKALVLKSARIEKGKSLKNLKYPSEFDQFCNLLASTSPRAYRTFQKTFGGPGLRAMRAKRAKLPRFQPDIAAFNVATAADILAKLKYQGPVGLSWDDTALEACISVYQETKEVCLILGGADGAIRVTEQDDLEILFENAKLNRADKLRVWLLSIPLPKIPPILIAAVARGSSTKADDLVKMHHKLADLLHEYNIHPISLSSDGAEVERAAQRIIARSAPTYHIYVVPNPTTGCTIEIKIPLYYGQHPTIILQDSKHALKTARNQIMTGARVLVLGFFPVLYEHLWKVAEDPASPLYTSDVQKVDKQDDRAAARLFSAQTLEFQLEHYPSHTGTSVYLFIMGEMIDAWQNRNICHRDRIKMVLRARFFLMAWRAHTESHPDHKLQTQFISRESFDIFMTICDGLLALVVAYRKYFPTYPLLPWLHSTEVCEHLFGMLRQLKKDFNYADVLYLERKLRVLMMGAFGNQCADEQANQTSAGYYHTYFKADDLDTAALTQYPTDEEIANASTYAYEEASQLLKVLGIDAERMLKQYQAPVDPAPARLTFPPRPPQTIMELLALYQSVPLKSSKEEETFEAYEMALAAEDLDKSLAIAALPDSTDDSLEDLRSDIEKTLSFIENEMHRLGGADSVVDLALPLTLNATTLHDLVLVSERKRHQTKSTKNAVRVLGRASLSMLKRKTGVSATPESAPSLRESLLARLAAVLPPPDSRTKTAGVDRYVRHAGTFGGSGVPATVRAQNKATVKSVAATKFVAARTQAFAPVQWIHETMYRANITEYNPLKTNDFVFVLKPGSGAPEVVLGSVIALFTKSTMHDWTPVVRSVGAPSYIYVLAYRQFAGALFTSMACDKLACPTILQIPRTHLLFSLASFTKITQQDAPTDGYPHTLVNLCPESLKLLQDLRRSSAILRTGIQELERLMKSESAVGGSLVIGTYTVDEEGRDEHEEQEEEVREADE
ncbi:hypothetical protein DFH06DRAFT_1331114 [Mycena polygramma]|nr:hypothetical protein DFH06DRAFT_1331114 [Mycena polygramma]